MPNHVNNCALFHIYYALLYRLLHGRNLGQFREWGVISQQWYQSNFPNSGIRAISLTVVSEPMVQSGTCYLRSSQENGQGRNPKV